MTVLLAALACQAPAAPAATIDWSAPNSETPAPVIPNAQAAKGNLGFGVKPAIAPQSGGDFLKPRPEASAPAAAATPSIADLFRERNAREAAARAAAAPAAPAAVPDGTYRCRRTDSSLVCGTNEEEMRRIEAANKAMLDRLTAPN